jgi:hydrogenase/urease accessory protein HupE
MQRALFLILVVSVSLWDVDAMRVHISAHSWTTLAYVSIFLVGHLTDLLTIGRISTNLELLERN